VTGATVPAHAHLRPWRTTDAAALRAAATDPEVSRQLGGAVFADDPAAEAFITTTLRFGPGARHWAVVLDGTAVGSVAVSAIERRHDTGWVSYWLAPEVRGRGLATAALVAAAADAFALGLHRLELGHRTNNPASCAVATRAGFAPEGIEREKLRYGDRRYDVETHARLASDPEPAHAALACVVSDG
jgi:RimJ/RimL family protein N-acetyltransferase